MIFFGACSELLAPAPGLAAEVLPPLPPPFEFAFPRFRKRGSLAAFTIFPWLVSRW